MMEKKIILQELCDNLEKELNIKEETAIRRTVNLFSGFKPSGYYLPQIHIGTTKTVDSRFEMAWFVEISIDGKVIFRESYIPKESECLNIVECFMINRILRNIFTYGVMSSKKFIDDYDNKNK